MVWGGDRHARGAAKRTLCTAQMCRGCNTVVIVSYIRKIARCRKTFFGLTYLGRKGYQEMEAALLCNVTY